MDSATWKTHAHQVKDTFCTNLQGLESFQGWNRDSYLAWAKKNGDYDAKGLFAPCPGRNHTITAMENRQGRLQLKLSRDYLAATENVDDYARS